MSKNSLTIRKQRKTIKRIIANSNQIPFAEQLFMKKQTAEQFFMKKQMMKVEMIKTFFFDILKTSNFDKKKKVYVADISRVLPNAKLIITDKNLKIFRNKVASASARICLEKKDIINNVFNRKVS